MTANFAKLVFKKSARYRLMLNKQCTTLPNVYCSLFTSKEVFSATLTDFEFAWMLRKKQRRNEFPNELFCQVCSLTFKGKILNTQFIKTLTKDRDQDYYKNLPF